MTKTKEKKQRLLNTKEVTQQFNKVDKYLDKHLIGVDHMRIMSFYFSKALFHFFEQHEIFNDFDEKFKEVWKVVKSNFEDTIELRKDVDKLKVLNKK